MVEKRQCVFSAKSLIEEVEKYPGLYRDHCDRNERLALWKQIGEALYPDWASYNRATAYDKVLELQSKWRSLRDGYKRELRFRRTGRRTYRATYKYFKRMLFLGGFDGNPDEITAPESEDESDEPNSCADSSQVASEKDLLPELDDTPVTSFSAKRKRKVKRSPKRDPVPEEVMYMELPCQSDMESDKLFLLSFLPEMHQLPPNIKMWARTQVAQIMQEAVAHQMNGTSPGTGRSEPNIF